jgi:hypothetical protein
VRNTNRSCYTCVVQRSHRSCFRNPSHFSLHEYFSEFCECVTFWCEPKNRPTSMSIFFIMKSAKKRNQIAKKLPTKTLDLISENFTRIQSAQHEFRHDFARFFTNWSQFATVDPIYIYIYIYIGQFVRILKIILSIFFNIL